MFMLIVENCDPYVKTKEKAIASLDHPRILPLFSYGEEPVNGTTYTFIVMPHRREGTFVPTTAFFPTRRCGNSKTETTGICYNNHCRSRCIVSTANLLARPVASTDEELYNESCLM